MKIRIALAVSEDGHWCASGGGEEDQEMASARQNCDICGAGSTACYWIEVEVPGTPATRSLSAEINGSESCPAAS